MIYPGDRVSVTNRSCRGPVKGVLAEVAQTYVIIVLDDPLEYCPRFTGSEAYAARTGVNPKQCLLVPHDEFGRRVQKVYDRNDEKLETMFVCSMCTRPVQRRDVVLSCQHHQICWSHLIPDDPDRGVLELLFQQIHDLKPQLGDAGVRMRALLIYQNYCEAPEQEKEIILRNFLQRNKFDCSVCERPQGKSLDLIGRQFVKKDKSGQNPWARFSVAARNFIEGLFQDSSDFHDTRDADNPPPTEADRQRKQFLDRCVAQLCESHDDRDLCTAAVAQAFRSAPTTVREEQFMAFCFQELRKLQDDSSAPRSDALSSSNSYRTSHRDTLASAAAPRRSNDLSSNMNSPQSQASKQSSTEFVKSDAHLEELVQELLQLNIDRKTATDTILSLSKKYPCVADQARFLQYCADDALPNGKREGDQRNFDTAPAKLQLSSPSRPQTRSVTASKVPLRAQLTERLGEMNYSISHTHEVVDRVLNQVTDFRSVSFELLIDQCVTELQDAHPNIQHATGSYEKPRFEGNYHNHDRRDSHEQDSVHIHHDVAAATGIEMLAISQPPMDIEERKSEYRHEHEHEHEREQKQKQQESWGYHGEHQHLHSAPAYHTTLEEVRISAALATDQLPTAIRIPKGLDYEDLRARVLQGVAKELLSADVKDLADYKLYLARDNFSQEIAPEQNEVTVTVEAIRSRDAVFLWHPNGNIGPRQKLADLAINFKYNASMKHKVAELENAYGYEGWRRIRGDGNCYYRAVVFGYLEQLVTHRKRTELLNHFLRMMQSVEYEHGSEEDDMHKRLLVKLQEAADGKTWTNTKELEASVLNQTDGIDRALMLAVRQIIGRYLLEHAQEEFNEITLADTILTSYDVDDMQQYVERYVLTLGEDAEGSFVYLGIMFKALGIAGRTVFLDRRDNVELTILRTPDEDMEVNVHLLLRPGHYDLLYYRPHDT